MSSKLQLDIFHVSQAPSVECLRGRCRFDVICR